MGLFMDQNLQSDSRNNEKTNDVIIFLWLYIRPSLSRGHHQSDEFLHSYNEILKVEKLN